MRKFLTIISAILLAFLITAGILSWQGVDLSRAGILNFLHLTTPTTPKLPSIPTIKEQEEVNLSYDERLQKGDYYFERGFLTFASNEYVKAANLEPDRVDPYLKLIKTHLELRNYQKALANAEIVLKMKPGDQETLYHVIVIHTRLSEFDKAKSLLESFPKTTPPNPRVLYYQGLISALSGDHEAAGKSLKEAMGASTDPALISNIKTVLEAYQEFDVTKAAEPVYLSQLLARSLNKVNEYEMAIHLLKEVLKARTDLRDGWILLGFAYLNLEKYQFALTAFEKAYSLDSEWPTTQYFLGLTHKELNRPDDSIIFFNMALSNDFEPKLVVFKQLADLYFETKNYAKSVENYEKILALSKEDINSFVRPVWLYLDFLNDPKRAIKLAETAALAFPESAMSYNLMGWSYGALGDDKKAEENLKRAIAIDPGLAAAYYNLGNLYRKQEKTSLALETFQKAYNLDANGSIGSMSAQAYNDLLQTTTPSNSN